MSNTPETDPCSAGEIMLLDGILATIAWTHKRRASREYTSLGMVEQRLKKLVDRHAATRTCISRDINGEPFTS